MGFLVTFLQLLLPILQIALLGRVIISWVDPSNQWFISQALHELTEPFLAPIRRLLPNMGMIDFSPMIALLLMTIIQTALPPM